MKIYGLLLFFGGVLDFVCVSSHKRSTPAHDQPTFKTFEGGVLVNPGFYCILEYTRVFNSRLYFEGGVSGNPGFYCIFWIHHLVIID